jgi:hypothetical protein
MLPILSVVYSMIPVSTPCSLHMLGACGVYSMLPEYTTCSLYVVGACVVCSMRSFSTLCSLYVLSACAVYSMLSVFFWMLALCTPCCLYESYACCSYFMLSEFTLSSGIHLEKHYNCTGSRGGTSPMKWSTGLRLSTWLCLALMLQGNESR